MNLDAEFKKDLDEFAKTLENSKYLEGFAQSMADEHAKDGTEPEDMIGDFDAIGEDVTNICRDYVNTIVHDKPDEVWDAINNEVDIGTMLAYAGNDSNARTIRAYFKRPYDSAIDDDYEDDLSDACVDLLMNLYVYEQGGWYDLVDEVYENAILKMYDKIVA